MCCGNKAKKIEKQPVKPVVTNNSNIASSNNPNASVLRSKVPIDKKLQKSTVKIQQVSDPRVINFFKDCKTQRIQLYKITNQHNSYVRQYDYFDLSNGHQSELKKLTGLPDTRGAVYTVTDTSSLSTPTVNRFCYDRNITDVAYIPKTTQYRSFYQNDRSGNLPAQSNAKQGTYENHSANKNIQESPVQPVPYNREVL